MAKKKKVSKEKEPSMAEKVGTREGNEGEQLDLIDINPENAKEIVAIARQYKKHQAARMEAGSKEKTKKEELKAFIRDANLQPLEDGKYRLRLAGLLIEMTPRDELITVKEEVEK